jgi:hypothetical protein
MLFRQLWSWTRSLKVCLPSSLLSTLAIPLCFYYFVVSFTANIHDYLDCCNIHFSKVNCKLHTITVGLQSLTLLSGHCGATAYELSALSNGQLAASK